MHSVCVYDTRLARPLFTYCALSDFLSSAALAKMLSVRYVRVIGANVLLPPNIRVNVLTRTRGELPDNRRLAGIMKRCFASLLTTTALGGLNATNTSSIG